MFKKPNPGDLLHPYVGNSKLWAALITMLNEWTAAKGKKKSAPKASPSVKPVFNTPPTEDMAAGTVIDFTVLSFESKIQANTDPAKQQAILNNPLITVLDGAGAIVIDDNQRIANKPLKHGEVRSYEHRYVNVEVDDEYKDEDYVSIDPDFQGKLTFTKGSGQFRVLGHYSPDTTLYPDTSKHVLLDVEKSQQFWWAKVTGSWVTPLGAVDDPIGDKTANAEIYPIEQEGAPSATSYLYDTFAVYTTGGLHNGVNVGDWVLVKLIGSRYWLINQKGGGGNKIFMTPAGGIPARTASTAGFADCAEYEIDAATGAMTTTGETEKIFNIFSTPAAGDVFIEAQQQPNGAWVIDAEDCDQTLCDAILANCEPYSQPDPP